MSDDDSKQSVKAQILASVERFRLCANESNSRQEVGKQLVKLLTECLAAYGATLWWPHRSWLTGQRELKADFSCGQKAKSRRFARSVAVKSETEFSVFEDLEAGVLHIGIPVVTNTNSRGVIEILQRPGRGQQTIRGYVRFTRETAKILRAAKAFGAG